MRKGRKSIHQFTASAQQVMVYSVKVVIQGLAWWDTTTARRNRLLNFATGEPGTTSSLTGGVRCPRCVWRTTVMYLFAGDF
jgi:hypothetical protein